MTELTKIQWLLGNTCNYRCIYCPDHLHNGSIPAWDQIVLADSIRYLAGLIRYEGRTPQFDFVGGEPTLNEGLITGLSSTGANWGGNSRLVTNAHKPVEWWNENLDLFDYVEISYHVGWSRFEHITDVYNTITREPRDELDTRVGCEIQVHLTNDDSMWNRGWQALEQFLELGFQAKPKLLYSNFTRGTQLFPYKNYQLKQYYRHLGQEFDPKPTQHIDSTGYIPASRRRNDIKREQLENTSYNYQGQQCWSGIDQLIVFHTGEVYNGWCKTQYLGNVKTQDVGLPREPLECPLDYCRNGFDRNNRRSL